MSKLSSNIINFQLYLQLNPARLSREYPFYPLYLFKLLQRIRELSRPAIIFNIIYKNGYRVTKK